MGEKAGMGEKVRARYALFTRSLGHISCTLSIYSEQIFSIHNTTDKTDNIHAR